MYRMHAFLDKFLKRDIKQLTSFAVIGAIGFAVDAIVLYVVMNSLGLGPISGRIISIMAAMLTTWFLNRVITFSVKYPAKAEEIVRYAAVKCVGLVANLTIYTAIVLAVTKDAYPFVALVAASAASLAINFGLVKRFVFPQA